MKLKLIVGIVLLALAAFGYVELSGSPAAPTSAPAVAERQIDDGIRRVVEDVAIKNYDEVIYRGPVDLSATIERIRAGIKHPHRNDGSVFGNRERLLPRKPRGYYREYVHPTDSLSGPGPQRLVVGADADWWYTPDHYDSFVSLGTEVR